MKGNGEEQIWKAGLGGLNLLWEGWEPTGPYTDVYQAVMYSCTVVWRSVYPRLRVFYVCACVCGGACTSRWLGAPVFPSACVIGKSLCLRAVCSFVFPCGHV